MANAVSGEPGLGLDGGRISSPRMPWSALAVTGDRGIDQPWVPRGEGLVVQPEEAERTGAKVLDDHVRRVTQAKRQLAGAGHVEVDADIALAGILLRVIARHPRCRGKRETRDIGPRRLDLDHLRAEIEQSAGARIAPRPCGIIRRAACWTTRNPPYADISIALRTASGSSSA